MNRRAFILGAAMVLLCSFVAISLRSFAEAAFLGAYGPRQMPWLLIANAGGFAVATLGYDALTRIAHARTVDVVLLASLALAAGAAPLLLRAGIPPGVLVVALAATSQVAGLALWNRVCAAVAGRDARRFLPRAGAAVTLGGAIAGLGSGALIPRIGLDAVPLAGAVVTLVVIVVCIAQERTLVTGGAPGGTPGGPGMPAKAGATAAPAPLLTNPQRGLVGAMLAVAALEGIVTTVIDLQFIGTVKARYSGQDVAVALALFYGGTNALLFVLQSAAVPHILVTRAMTFTAAVHPVVVVLSYAGFAAAPSFLGIAGTRTADQVLRFATSRTSQELELSALPPAPRGRWKVLLRGAVGPAGMALAALVLLALGPVAVRSPTTLALVAIGIALAWAIAARIAARRFQVALAAPLGIRSTQQDDPRRIDLDTLERWTMAAGVDDERQAALARAALARARVDATDLADHLRHDDAAVRGVLFDQLARTPAPALRGELRAAIGIEDDDRALALGIRALAIAGDDAGVTRGKERAGLSRDVDEATATSERMLRGGHADAELRSLLARDATWATAFVRARRQDLPDQVLANALRAAVVSTSAPTHPRVSGPAGAAQSADAELRGNAFAVIANLALAPSLAMLADALASGDPAAFAAIEQLDADAAARIVLSLDAFAPLARVTLARSLSAAPAATPPLAALVDDRDPEVAHAALRAALAVARGGADLPVARITAAHFAALAALEAHLDARDAVAALAAPSAEGSAEARHWSACARTELEIATRRSVARTLWAAALDASASGRDPAPIAASARHLLGARDADRKRALDVVQELQARPRLLAAIERWLRPAKPRPNPAALDELRACDPWLGGLAAGELAHLEPAIVELRRPALFASVAGPALAALAERAVRIAVTSELFAIGQEGETMYVVTAGALAARRPDEEERRVTIGAVVGELAVLSHSPRAATLVAVDGDAEVLSIDRDAFMAAARRAPELVLGLSATLAGWLAPTRPDVL